MADQDNRKGIWLMIATSVVFAAQDGISRHLATNYSVMMVVMIVIVVMVVVVFFLVGMAVLAKVAQLQAEQVLHELVFDRRRQVQRVQRQFIGQHLLDSFDHHRVVVPQRESAGASQAVDKRTTFNILDIQAFGTLEGQRNAPRVAAGVGLLLLLALQQRRIGEFVQGLRQAGRCNLGKAGSGGHG